MSFVATLAAVLLTGLAGPREDPTVATVQQQLFERCPAVLQAPEVEVSDAIETSDGLAVFTELSAEERTCSVFVQSRVAPSLAAVRARLEAEGWTPGEDGSAWRRDGGLIAISQFEEDGVPGATFTMVDMEGPTGRRFAAYEARRDRPMVDTARHALFELCPALIEGDDARRRDIVTAEPELFSETRRAHPVRGRTFVRPQGSSCAVRITGGPVRETLDALKQDAIARGYTEDTRGVLWANDRVILIQTISSCLLPTDCQTDYIVQLFERTAYETMVANRPAPQPVGRRRSRR